MMPDLNVALMSSQFPQVSQLPNVSLNLTVWQSQDLMERQPQNLLAWTLTRTLTPSQTFMVMVSQIATTTQIPKGTVSQILFMSKILIMPQFLVVSQSLMLLQFRIAPQFLVVSLVLGLLFNMLPLVLIPLFNIVSQILILLFAMESQTFPAPQSLMIPLILMVPQSLTASQNPTMAQHSVEAPHGGAGPHWGRSSAAWWSVAVQQHGAASAPASCLFRW